MSATHAGLGTVEIDVQDLFRDGELRLWQHDDGWEGYVEEDGNYYWTDTRRSGSDWTRQVPVTENAVRNAVERHIRDPAAGGRGHFEWGVEA